MSVTALILAGGLSRRMGGGDKPLKMLGKQTLLSRVVNRVSMQTPRVLLNINGDAARFSSFNLPIVQDLVQDFSGPLAGILAGMERVKENSTHLLSIPSDSPFLPRDLLNRLLEIDADVVSVRSNNQNHPIIALWSLTLLDGLRASLAAGERKIDQFTARFNTHYVNFAHVPFDPFFNCNSIEDLIEAEAVLKQYPLA